MKKAYILFISLLILQALATDSVERNYFHFGSHVIPHPDKVEKGGEDAFYASKNLIAVADGVGGWNNQGVDPSKYSKTLCSGIGALVEEDPDKYITNPIKYAKLSHKDNTHLGSSTLVIVALDPHEPILRTYNLGDSGYIILRLRGKKNWHVAFVSEEQQKGFNYPYQLAYKPEHGDRPDAGETKAHHVQDGDIVIVASDGMIDNLYPKQVLQTVQKKCLEENVLVNPEECAEKLAKFAFEKSLDTKYNSPFAARAKKKNYKWIGGKSDDITVSVGQIRMTEISKQLGKEQVQREVQEVLNKKQKEKKKPVDDEL